MDLADYERQRRLLETGVHRPSDMWVGSDAANPVLKVWLSLKDYPELESIFRPLAEGEEVTLGEYIWRPLAPPPGAYSHERPLMMRLGLAFKLPAELRLPLLFKIETYHHLAYAAAIAESGMIVLALADAPDDLNGLELPLAVDWPELGERIKALLSSGVIKPP